MTLLRAHHADLRSESLTVAMALAPGVYSRNRMFALFAQPGVQRAKFRAAALRGLVKQLARAANVSLTSEGDRHVLSFQIPALRMSRVADLSPVELATLRVLLSQAGVPCLPAEDADRALVDRMLALLLEHDADGSAERAARSARDSTTPPPTPPAE